MNKNKNRLAGICISVFALLAISGPAMAQDPEATVLQLLDSVTVLGKDFGIGLNDDEPPGFDELLNDSALDFIDCDANTAHRFVVRHIGLTTLRRSWLTQYPTRPPFGDLELLANLVDHLPSPGRA